MPMRVYKIVWLLVSVLLVLCATYGIFMWVYTDHMFAPVTLLDQPRPQSPAPNWTGNSIPFVHKVNTPARARQKDALFEGFEVDVLKTNNQFLAAHDEQEATRRVTLADIFASVDNPAQKYWWMDLKSELTAEDLQTLLQLADQFHIPTDHLFWEAAAGPTAKLLKQHHLRLLLSLPDGFENDAADPARRQQINQAALALWQEYEPTAVAASFGKYGHLKAYFPNMPKAIYYSATVRPSLKKPFMRHHMQKDPSVKIFMTDEYTFLPF